jgi:F-type H+-transporting ATPase subunit gamma
MATLKEVKLKISGVKKTKQITSAMKMVATSRLRGAQMAMDAFRPYAGKYADVLGSLAQKAGEGTTSPLLEPREEVKKVHIVLCTSDRGLCGGFNINLIKKAESLIKEKSGDGFEVSVTCFGKKGRDWAKKENHITIAEEYLGVVGSKFGFSTASVAGRKLIDNFLTNVYDEVYLVYAQFQTMSRQVPTLAKILPIPPIEIDENSKESDVYLAEHICEPSSAELLAEMLPKNVYIQIYKGLLETSTSEHAARMSAMENATKACSDMIGELQQIYNKARQAAITADLMDIVGGAEALKG